MPTLTATVVNCLIGGMEFTDYPDGSRTRNIINFECDKWTFRFLQKDEVITQSNSLRGTSCVTTTVEVVNVDQASLTDALETLDAICWLLSFATQSQVLRYGYQFPAITGNSHFRSASGTIANPTRPPFNLHSGKGFKNFIEQTYPAYHEIHKIRNLPVVFDYLTQAERPDQHMEIRLLLLFITLENLKHTFAHSEKIPFVNNYFRKPGIEPEHKRQKYSFQELVKMALDKVSMNDDLTSIKKLRNNIIHTGLTGESIEWQQNMYENIHDIVREYLLRLLGYKGNFNTYKSRGFGFKEIS